MRSGIFSTTVLTPKGKLPEFCATGSCFVPQSRRVSFSGFLLSLLAIGCIVLRHAAHLHVISNHFESCHVGRPMPDTGGGEVAGTRTRALMAENRGS